MIISIDLYLDTISGLNFMGFHGSRVGMETNFLPIPLLHKIGITFDSHYVSLDDVDPLGLQGQVFWVRWLPAIFSPVVRLSCPVHAPDWDAFPRGDDFGSVEYC
jgi:hypothetical protein